MESLKNIIEKALSQKENFNDLEVAILLEWGLGFTPAVVGETGVGKTSIITSLAKKLNLPLIVLETGTLSESEAGVMPLMNEEDKIKGSFRYAVPWWAVSEEPRIIFFDELNRAQSTDVFNALMNFILSRRVGSFVAKNCLTVAAMNPTNDDYYTRHLDKAQKRRLTIINYTPSYAQVKKFFLDNLKDDELKKAELLFEFFEQVEKNKGVNFFMYQAEENLISPALIEGIIKRFAQYEKINRMDLFFKYLFENVCAEFSSFFRAFYTEKSYIQIQWFERGEIEKIKKIPPADLKVFLSINLLEHKNIFEKFFTEHENELLPEVFQGVAEAVDKNIDKFTDSPKILEIWGKFFNLIKEN